MSIKQFSSNCFLYLIWLIKSRQLQRSLELLLLILYILIGSIVNYIKSCFISQLTCGARVLLILCRCTQHLQHLEGLEVDPNFIISIRQIVRPSVRLLFLCSTFRTQFVRYFDKIWYMCGVLAQRRNDSDHFPHNSLVNCF